MGEKLDDARRKLRWAIERAILTRGRPLIISIRDLHQLYGGPPIPLAGQAVKTLSMPGVTYEQGKVVVR